MNVILEWTINRSETLVFESNQLMYNKSQKPVDKKYRFLVKIIYFYGCNPILRGMVLKQLSVEEAKEILKKDLALLFDIRDEESYTQEHAKGAIRLTHKMLGDLVTSVDKQTPIVVMCYHGISSLQAVQVFLDEGFEDVSSVEGGYEAWKLYKHRAPNELE